METKGLTAAQLRGKLAERGITRKQFAEVAHISLNEMYQIFNGAKVGPTRKARIERAIRELRLTEPTEGGGEKLVFRVTQL